MYSDLNMVVKEIVVKSFVRKPRDRKEMSENNRKAVITRWEKYYAKKKKTYVWDDGVRRNKKPLPISNTNSN